VIGVLRDAAWLDAERARVYPRILLAVTCVVVVGLILVSPGGVDPQGRPIGTDFLSFWAASKLALSGRATLAYDVEAHDLAQRSVIAGQPDSVTPFVYPPMFLLVCLPLAAAPYFVALTAWMAATGYACWRTVRAMLAEAGPGLTAPILAFPGVLQNLGYGQNAFLTTALFGSAALTLDRRPVLAGVFVGCLAIKPHLGLLIPLALLAGGRWKTIAAAGCTVAAFSGAALLVLGAGAWGAFLGASRIARMVLEQPWRPGMSPEGWTPAMMSSVFAAVRLMHGGLWLAYGVQASTALVAGAVVVRVARGSDGLALGATLVCATCLASPYLFDYDLMLLAIPLAWILRDARRTGFRPWEKSLLLAAFLLPMASRVIATRLGLPIGPPILMSLLLIVARRALPSGVEARPSRCSAPRLGNPSPAPLRSDGGCWRSPGSPQPMRTAEFRRPRRSS
jgi:hypothetical protein